MFEADLAILQSDREQASAAMDTARAVTAEHEGSNVVETGQGFWAVFALYAGHLDLAIGIGTEYLPRLEAVGNENLRRTVAAGLAEAQAMLGQRPEAEALLDDAAAADPSDLITHVLVDRARAWLALQQGELEAAESHAASAMARLERAEAPLDVAQTLVLQGAVAAARGDHPAARAALTTAREVMEAKEAHAAVRSIDERLGALTGD
jgi:tetratricopeptide (TPR) repeat protein